jgi:uncharacterized protein YwgA
MISFKRHALLLRTVECLQESGSWTGRTHLQKALFLVKAAGRIRVPHHYVLYKHGPYSFEVEQELATMRSYDAICADQLLPGYGPTLQPSKNRGFVLKAGKLKQAESREIRRVCRFVNGRNVADLERLATAAWVLTQERITNNDGAAARIHELKPHISVDSAKDALRVVARDILARGCSAARS